MHCLSHSGGALNTRQRWAFFLLAILSGIVFITTYPSPGQNGTITVSSKIQGNSGSRLVGESKFVKPENLTIIGLIFFGRRSNVKILKCYLERNLAENGGWLDEIHWVQNTDNSDDLAYLEEILASSTSYKKIELTDSDGAGLMGYENIWSRLERGKLYVKIDDDVEVWIDNDTIPSIVRLKITHPEFVLVSANMINNPLMGWIHYHMGAIHPYLPEPHLIEDPLVQPEVSTLEGRSWRYKDYPSWEGTDDWSFSIDEGPPYEGHRWLRLRHKSAIQRTPIARTEYGTWGLGLQSWAIAAQHHYSLLENLADQRLDRYRFGKPWITDYERLSINLITLWADEVLDNLPMDDVDEPWLTMTLPRKLGKSVAVDSEALAAHFSFITQAGVRSTDLLARYHSYATENACGT